MLLLKNILSSFMLKSEFIVRNSFVNSRVGSFTDGCSGKFDFP